MSKTDVRTEDPEQTIDLFIVLKRWARGYQKALFRAMTELRKAISGKEDPEQTEFYISLEEWAAVTRTLIKG